MKISRPELFCKNDVLKNLTKFTGKHLCQSVFFNKFASLRPVTLAQVFSCEFCDIFKNTFFIKHFRWLLLYHQNCFVAIRTLRHLIHCYKLLVLINQKECLRVCLTIECQECTKIIDYEMKEVIF